MFNKYFKILSYVTSNLAHKVNYSSQIFQYENSLDYCRAIKTAITSFCFLQEKYIIQLTIFGSWNIKLKTKSQKDILSDNLMHLASF